MLGAVRMSTFGVARVAASPLRMSAPALRGFSTIPTMRPVSSTLTRIGRAAMPATRRMTSSARAVEAGTPVSIWQSPGRLVLGSAALLGLGGLCAAGGT